MTLETILQLERLPPESLVWILTVSGITALIMAIIMRRHSRACHAQQSLWQQQQRDLELQLSLSQQQLHQSYEAEARLKGELEKLQHHSQQLATNLSEREARLAVLASKADELERLKLVLESKQQELRRLDAEYQGQLAKSAAEKHSLEDKLVLLKDAREQLSAEFSVLANRIFDDKQQHFTTQSQASLKASVDPLKEQLEAFRKKVEDVYDKENAERNKLFGQIVELQKQTKQIGEDAINLTNALKGDNKAQGNWGEIILERLLEQSGLQKGREYDVQVALKDENGRRRNPDVIIHLPEGKDVVIDSKVSLLSYEHYVSASDNETRQQSLKQHIASVRSHVQQLSAKSYEKLEGLRSLDFVFLFIPVEAAFMTALQADQALFQEAYSKHIILVSPTTLLASLRTVENIWRYEKQNRNAEEIARQAGGLHDQFALLFEAFEDMGKQIDKAADAYSLTRKRLVSGRGNLMRRIDGLRELGAKTKKQLPVDDSDDCDSAAEQVSHTTQPPLKTHRLTDQLDVN